MSAEGEATNPMPDTARAAAEGRRRILMIALEHDALDDAVTELLFDHVVLGRHHRTVVANSLSLILSEALNVADREDWTATGRHLLGDDADRAAGDGDGGPRRSEAGTAFAVALIRDLLRTVGTEVADHDEDLRAALAAAGELGSDADAVAALTERAVKDLLLGEASEEDWNLIAGRLIAEAREVSGPGAKGGRS